MASTMKTSALVVLVAAAAIAAAQAAPVKTAAAKQAAIRRSAAFPEHLTFNNAAPSPKSRRDGLFNDTTMEFTFTDGTTFGQYESDAVCNFETGITIADATSSLGSTTETVMTAQATWCPSHYTITDFPKVHIHGNHEHISDLDFYLVRGASCPGPAVWGDIPNYHPGDRIKLVSKAGGSDNFFNFIVWEGAADAAPVPATYAAGQMGSPTDLKVFRPIDETATKLNALKGTACCNDWTVEIADTDVDNVGAFVHWSISFPGCSHDGDME